jgi:hypothetical protein
MRLIPVLPASASDADPLPRAMLAQESAVPRLSADSNRSASETVMQFGSSEKAFMTMTRGPQEQFLTRARIHAPTTASLFPKIPATTCARTPVLLLPGIVHARIPRLIVCAAHSQTELPPALRVATMTTASTRSNAFNSKCSPWWLSWLTNALARTRLLPARRTWLLTTQWSDILFRLRPPTLPPCSLSRSQDIARSRHRTVARRGSWILTELCNPPP